MFGQVTREYIPYEKTVNINQAPTSEQAKYLEQLGKQAWESITVQMVKDLDDNLVSGMLLHRDTDHMNTCERFYAIFTLNGKKFEVPVKVNDTRHNPNVTERDFMMTIFETLSKEIAIQLMDRQQKI